jgi:hypothetical protein
MPFSFNGGSIGGAVLAVVEPLLYDARETLHRKLPSYCFSMTPLGKHGSLSSEDKEQRAKAAPHMGKGSEPVQHRHPGLVGWDTPGLSPVLLSSPAAASISTGLDSCSEVMGPLGGLSFPTPMMGS